jgi:two-component system nitrate/nitrite response regulator NarL
LKRFTDKRHSVPTVIVDKNTLFRVGLIHTLAGTRFRVTVNCFNVNEISTSVLHDRECLALVGLDQGSETILSQMQALKAQHEYLRIVTLSERFDPEELIASIRSGGDGYLLKNEINPDVLLKSIELVLLGEVVVPQEFTQMIRGQVHLQLYPLLSSNCLDDRSGYAPILCSNEVQNSKNVDRLSNREKMILRHLTQGSSNKHIARELSITEATVKVHIKSLLRKIRVRNRTQAAIWAMNHFETTDSNISL